MSTSELDQNTLDQIRKEELSRVILRKELATQEISAPPAWQALNSAFVLWLLSAIFISGTGALFNYLQKNQQIEQQLATESRANERTKKARIERLSMEFSCRLSEALIGLKKADSISNSGFSEKPDEVRLAALSPLLYTPSNQFQPLFPEFKDYSGIALIAEMSMLTEAGQAANLKDAIAAISGLLSDASTVKLDTPQAFRLIAGELLEKTKGVGRHYGFRYTDCKKSSPFC